jgi:hypothetical protein
MHVKMTRLASLIHWHDFNAALHRRKFLSENNLAVGTWRGNL